MVLKLTTIWNSVIVVGMTSNVVTIGKEDILCKIEEPILPFILSPGSIILLSLHWTPLRVSLLSFSVTTWVRGTDTVSHTRVTLGYSPIMWETTPPKYALPFEELPRSRGSTSGLRDWDGIFWFLHRFCIHREGIWSVGKRYVLNLTT